MEHILPDKEYFKRKKKKNGFITMILSLAMELSHREQQLVGEKERRVGKSGRKKPPHEVSLVAAGRVVISSPFVCLFVFGEREMVSIRTLQTLSVF